MTFSGKASMGCDSCRARRIKCNKARPSCIQCTRMGRQCPGYPDPVSMMFRDENSKVIKRAHARWAGELVRRPSRAESTPAGSSRPPPTPTSSAVGPSTPAEMLVGSPYSMRSSLKSQESFSPVSEWTPPSGDHVDEDFKILQRVDATPTERGVQFYIDHYVLGHPDEPRTLQELNERDWFFHPLPQNIMAAIGLAGMSNLREDAVTKDVARSKYVTALHEVGMVIQDTQKLDASVLMRCVVMLALYEVVKGTHITSHSAQSHIVGAAALMKSLLPLRNSPAGGIKGLMQLCYSLLIPCIISGVDLPAAFFEWTNMGKVNMPLEERPSIELLALLVKFIHVSQRVRNQAFTDGSPATDKLIGHVLSLDVALDSWEAKSEGKWVYTVFEGGLPPEACFHGRYHRYQDMWTARVWSHYRWGRILLLQLLLDLANRYPTSGRLLNLETTQAQILETIRRVAEDVLISIPTHWKHPALDIKQKTQVETMGGAGAGAAGVPAIMFHLRAACCAPGVPFEYLSWSLELMETVWRDMGMLQVRSLVELLRAHRDDLVREGSVGIRFRDPWDE